MDEVVARGRPKLKPLKVFKPKHPLPRLHSYSGKANQEYWKLFPKNLKWPGSSIMNAAALEKLGSDLGLLDERFTPSSMTFVTELQLDAGGRRGCQRGARTHLRPLNLARRSPTQLRTGFQRGLPMAQSGLRISQRTPRSLGLCVG